MLIKSLIKNRVGQCYPRVLTCIVCPHWGIRCTDADIRELRMKNEKLVGSIVDLLGGWGKERVLKEIGEFLKNNFDLIDILLNFRTEKTSFITHNFK